MAAREQEAGERIAEANRKVIESLGAEHDALAMTGRQRFVSQALRRLSAEATDAERRQVREMAGALFDEQQAIEARNEAEEDAAKLKEKGRALTESLRNAEEAYKAEIADLNRLLDEAAISQETFARASEDAHDRMLGASREWSAGVIRALRDYSREASNAARQFEQATTASLEAGEDAFVRWAATGKFSAADLFNTIAEEALRAAYRMAVVKPLGGILESIMGSFGGAIFGGLGGPSTGGGPPPTLDAPAYGGGGYGVAHAGGVIGTDGLPRRVVDGSVFDHAPRFHGGGLVGGEVPIIARKQEGVFTPRQMDNADTILRAALSRPAIQVLPTVYVNAPGVRARTQVARTPGGDIKVDVLVEELEARMGRNIGRGEGLALPIERRYGLYPRAFR